MGYLGPGVLHWLGPQAGAVDHHAGKLVGPFLDGPNAHCATLALFLQIKRRQCAVSGAAGRWRSLLVEKEEETGVRQIDKKMDVARSMLKSPQCER